MPLPPPPHKPLFALFGVLAYTLGLLPGAAQADDECGAVNNGRVACNGSSYSNGIRYRNHDGLDLTVGANGAVEIQPRANANGVHMETRTSSHTGAYTLRAHGRTQILQNGSSNGVNGIFVRQGGTGSTSVRVDSGAQLGTATARWGERGINVFYDQASSALLDIANNGNLFSDGASVRNAAGIVASRNNGSGRIKIANGGLIDSRNLGIFAYHAGEGAIEIDNRGSINAAGSSRSDGNRGIVARQAGAGGIDIRHSGSIVSEGWGIFARKDGTGGGISIESSGNIETTGEGMHGILVDVRSAATATDPVAIKMTDGTIKATGSGVNVNQRTQGAVTIELLGDGSIGTRDSRAGAFGIAASINNQNNDQRLSIDSDGKIFANSIGISGSHTGTGGLEIAHSGHIDSMNHRGISASHSGAGNIKVTHSGRIDSRSHGILTHHTGSGGTEIENTGEIVAGGHGIRAYQQNAGQIDITHAGQIVSVDHGIFARHDGPGTEGGIAITSRGDIRTTGYRRTGIDAQMFGDDAGGRISVHHESGFIESHRGISARSLRFSGSTFGPPTQGYPDTNQPVVRVVLGGEIKARRTEYDPNLDEAVSEYQVGWKVRDLREGASDDPRGITVASINTQQVGEYIAAGDAGDTTITDEMRMQFRALLKAAQDVSDSPGSELQLGDLFDPRNLVGFDPENMPDLTDDSDLDDYLKADEGAVLKKFLEHTLSAAESAVLEALFRREGLEAALRALPSSYSDAYKDQVRWYAGAYNDANLLAEVVDGGRIESEGDGIRALHGIQHDKNGSITVRVREGATVTAHRYGVFVIGAGIDDRGTPEESDDIRDQTVEVGGRVESTGPEGAGVYLGGGGRVVVEPEGRIAAASGVSIQADDPGLLIVEVRLQEGESLADAAQRATPGTIVNDGQRTEIQFIEPDGTASTIASEGDAPSMAASGAFDVSLAKGAAGFRVAADYAPRSRVYEALASVLLGMNGISGHGAFPDAPRKPDGTWARVTGGAISWRPDRSTSATSYRNAWARLDVGKDISLRNNQDLTVSLHHRIGSADVRRGGEIDVSGTGFGLSYAKAVGGSYVRLGGAATLYDIDLESSARGRLRSGKSGFGYAFDAEAGRGTERYGAMMTLSAGLAYSSVDVGDFTDKLGVEVSSLSGWNVKSRLGLEIEKSIEEGRLFGSVGVEQEIGAGKAEAVVAGTKLSSDARNTMFRLGGGMAFDHLAGATSGLVVLNYGTDGDGYELQGTLSLQF